MNQTECIKLENQLVIFTLDEQRYALPLSAVHHIHHTVEITPLPEAPEIVVGIINVQGQVIPVFNIRRRFRLPERDMELSDRLLVADTSVRKVALIVDEVLGLIQGTELQLIEVGSILPGIEHIEGVAKLEDGMILIHDIDKFLSLDEKKELDAVLIKD